MLLLLGQIIHVAQNKSNMHFHTTNTQNLPPASLLPPSLIGLKNHFVLKQDNSDVTEFLCISNIFGTVFFLFLIHLSIYLSGLMETLWRTTQKLGWISLKPGAAP